MILCAWTVTETSGFSGGKQLPGYPDRLRANVVVPKFLTTGVAVRVAEDCCEIDLDHSEDSALIEICVQGEVFKLRWNTRRRVGRFLFVAKAWRGWNGNRYFRVQSHRCFADGVIWWREILFEKVNGKIVKPVKCSDSIRELVSQVQDG